MIQSWENLQISYEILSTMHGGQYAREAVFHGSWKVGIIQIQCVALMWWLKNYVPELHVFIFIWVDYWIKFISKTKIKYRYFLWFDVENGWIETSNNLCTIPSKMQNYFCYTSFKILQKQLFCHSAYISIIISQNLKSYWCVLKHIIHSSKSLLKF